MSEKTIYSKLPFLKGAPGSLRAQLVRGAVGSGLIQIINRLLMLALGILLARGLGAEGYGIYAYAFAIMSLLMVVSEAGVPTLLLREVAAAQGQQEWGLLRGALQRGGQLVALAAMSVSLTGLIVLWWLANELEKPVLYTTALMLLLLPATALSKTIAHAIRGLHRVVIGQAVDMLLRPLLGLSCVSAVFFTWPSLRLPQYAMAAQLTAALVVLLVGVLVLRCYLPKEAQCVPAVYRTRQWLNSAMPFTLIGGAGIINTQADIIMLGWLGSAQEVGVYRVATQGGVLVMFFLQVANSVLAPKFSRLLATNQTPLLRNIFKKIAFIVVVLTVPIVFSFVAFGDHFVSIIFGPSYTAAATPLAILALGYFLNVSFGPVGMLLQMAGYESVTARVLWIVAGINIALNAILIPLFGIIGAAFSTAITVFLYHAFLRYIVWTKLAF